jgi:hypothetical protein
MDRLSKMIARKQIGDVNLRVYETTTSLVALDDQDYVVAIEPLDDSNDPRTTLDLVTVRAERMLGVRRPQPAPA